ncbi:MAG: tetratricopeptide repeat protein [Anaerolineae bacterium]
MSVARPVRLLNRPYLFLYSIIGLVALSWGLNHWQAFGSTFSLAPHYFSGAIDRTGASTDRLIKTLQSRLRTEPEDWQAYSQLGLAYLQKARESGDPTYYEKVEGALQQALKREPDDYTAVSGLGALALARHQFQTALEWGERARHINAYRSYAYGVIADAQIELGRYPEAAQTLQTMVNLRPDLSSYSRISYARELHGDATGAVEMMQQAVDSAALNNENGAWTRTQLANLYFNLGQLAQAEMEYQRTLEMQPGYVYALAGLGRVRAAQGRTDEAIDLLTQAAQAMPLPEFVITLGDLYQVTGQPKAAQQQYDLLRTIQKLYQANGVDLDLEIALFEADHGHNPLETVKQARQAYERRPSIHAADTLAWALYQAGDYRQAQSFSQQALHLGTKDALKLFHAGMIAYRLDNQAQARTYLEQALAINPYFSILHAAEARRTLEMLKH